MYIPRAKASLAAVNAAAASDRASECRVDVVGAAGALFRLAKSKTLSLLLVIVVLGLFVGIASFILSLREERGEYVEGVDGLPL